MPNYIELTDFELEYLKIRLQLRKLMQDAYVNSDKSIKDSIFYLYYSRLRDVSDVNKVSAAGSTIDKDIYFPTVESAENAILLIGADRLKKYYFCVEGTEVSEDEQEI